MVHAIRFFQRTDKTAPMVRHTTNEYTVLKIFQNMVDAFQQGVFDKKKDEFARELAYLNAQQLHELIEKLCQIFTSSSDPLSTIKHLSSILPIETLEKSIQLDHSTYVSAFETAKDMLQEAKHILEKTAPKKSSSLHTKWESFIDTIISTIENILAVSGINQIFKPSEDDYDADLKGERLMGLITLMSLLTTALVPIIGTYAASLIIGGILLTLISLALVYPFIRPPTEYLPSAENWTRAYQQGKLSVVEGRKRTLDEIAQTLISSKSVKTHPMLIGGTGVGKTEVAKRLVQAIEEGVYPELKGKKVFYFNAASLRDKDPKVLSEIRARMGKHQERFLFVIDEFHNIACQKNQDQASLGEQLKTRLDPGYDGYPYVIGITTELEFYRDIYKNNPALVRRFRRINIASTTPEETLEILQNILLQKSPKTIVEKGALPYLMTKSRSLFSHKKANELPEPATSIKTLMKCIQRTTESQKSPLEVEAESIRYRLQSLNSHSEANSGTLYLPYQEKKEERKLETRLQLIEDKVQKQKAKNSLFFRERDLLWDIKLDTCKKIIKAAEIKKENLTPENKRILVEFLLLSHFFIPAKEEHVKKEAERLGLKTVIDRRLIKKVIAEETATEKNVEHLIGQGKVLMKARTA